MTTTTDNRPSPAYRQKWFWFVMSPLLAVVVMSSIFVTLAFRHADDRVVGDYYRQGLAINEVRAKQQRAAALGLEGTLQFDSQLGEVALELAHTGDGRLPDQLTLNLQHPISASRDHQVLLYRQPATAEGILRYHGELSQGLAHRWYWRIRPQVTEVSQLWQLEGDIDFAEVASVPVNHQ